jgi:hypothetical protein
MPLLSDVFPVSVVVMADGVSSVGAPGALVDVLVRASDEQKEAIPCSEPQGVGHQVRGRGIATRDEGLLPLVRSGEEDPGEGQSEVAGPSGRPPAAGATEGEGRPEQGEEHGVPHLVTPGR